MIRPLTRLPSIFAGVVCLLQTVALADDFQLECSRPACGKVCKLVCETKKLTSICYGCQSKDICLPNPSRSGCKHCAACYGKCPPDSSANCQDSPPKCQFCWRDWFACGCAESRTVHVLTKYQAEKEICWYHWEVVDATCCDCVSNSDHRNTTGNNSAALARRTFYKPAPQNAELGDVLPVSEADWVKLAAVLAPDPTEVSAGELANSPKSENNSTMKQNQLNGETHPLSLAERIQRLLKK